MTRYIDADALYDYTYGFFCKNCAEQGAKCSACYMQDALGEIENAPSADVVEVRHGKWKQIYEKYPRYVCTVCNHLFNNKSFKFCPWCGARMDGD